MTIARRIARLWRETARRPLPREIAAVARLHLLDAIGVGIAAAGSEIGRPYLTYAQQTAASGPAAIFGYKPGASAPDAAMINGGLIHSLEYDDTHTASIAHGGAVLASAALAAGAASKASGAAVLGSYVRGWELLIRIGLAAPGGFQAKGFQVTSVGGALVAAMLAAELGGLDEAQSVAAMGIALSQASGVFEFLSNGATVKSLHPGWAAHSGLVAANLAKAGLTGPETSFEGHFGLFRIFAGDDAAAERLVSGLADFGTAWHLPDAAFKFQPCCHYLHPFVEAAGLLTNKGITADAIEHIVCRAPAGAAGIICEPWQRKQQPEMGHAARWSLPVAVASRIVEGKVDLDTFEQPPSPAVLALAARMSWESLADDAFPVKFEAELSCCLKNGAVREARVDDVYGNHSRPADAESVRQKFRANTLRGSAIESVTAIERAIDTIEDAADLAPLTQALRAAAELRRE